MVVAPDEELLAGQADPVDQLPGDQHAVERDDDVGEHAVAGGALDLGHVVRRRGRRPGSRIGKTSRSGSSSSTTTGPQKS